MNDFKFKDCRDCCFVGRGMNAGECRTCHSGENFEEAMMDSIEMMNLEGDELGSNFENREFEDDD